MESNIVTEREIRRDHQRDVAVALVGYVAVLVGVTAVARRQPGGLVVCLLMVLPMLPVLWGARAFLRRLARIDEFQRLVQLEAMAAGFGVAMLTALTVGFVGVAGVATPFAGWIVYTAGMVTWAFVRWVRFRQV